MDSLYLKSQRSVVGSHEACLIQRFYKPNDRLSHVIVFGADVSKLQNCFSLLNGCWKIETLIINIVSQSISLLLEEGSYQLHVLIVPIVETLTYI